MSEERILTRNWLGDGTAPAHTARVARMATLAGVVAATACVGLVDPARASASPLCPSRVLFGIDCPACGGLRGTHALLHGHFVEALDHNLLLPALLAVLGTVLVLWLRPLAGQPPAAFRPPRWARFGALAVVISFTVLRNLPVAPLDFLASD